MYFKHTNLDSIITELKRQLDDAECSLEAWECVKVNKKKDGGEFAQLQRAIEGGKLYDYIGIKNGKLSVVYMTRFQGWQTDEIYVYGFLDELPDTDERKKEYSRQLIRQKYWFTADEVRAAVKKHIEYKKQRISDLNKLIDIAPGAFAQYRGAIEQAEHEMREKVVLHRERMYPCRTLEYLLTETR